MYYIVVPNGDETCGGCGGFLMSAKSLVFTLSVTECSVHVSVNPPRTTNEQIHKTIPWMLFQLSSTTMDRGLNVGTLANESGGLRSHGICRMLGIKDPSLRSP